MSDSIDYSILLEGTTTTDPLLTALYGTSGTASSINPIQALNTAEKDETQDVAATAKEPQVARDIAAFTAALAKAQTPAELLNNPAALKVLLTANGLGDQVAYTALAQKALLSDTTKATSLADTLTDTRWKTVAETYDFANKGLTILNTPAVLATITNAYAEITWRDSLDAATPGLSNALSFRADASGITSVDQILGDSTLRTVVTTALGIPAQIAFQPLEAQERAISDRLDITQFKDPKFVESFVQRYLVAAGEAASTTSTSTTLTTLAIQAQGLVV